MAVDVAEALPPPSLDERLAYQGPIQRLLIQPEIGALFGAVTIWLFFWAVTEPFGIAGGTANRLDVAATLGIMSVAVAMLMIGGEFDLSSGAMTGATGILVILLVKEMGELGGAGLSLWIAIPLSFVLALGVGYFNGTLVERTSLPSFIVTLGAFFILKGAKLGFAKLFLETIQVGRIDEGAGYEFWRRVFSAVWIRNDHLFDGRDTLYVVLTIAGAVLMLAGLLELSFRRRSTRRQLGIVVLVLGAVAGVGGVVGLHSSTGAASDWTWSLVVAGGVITAIVGTGMWRYERQGNRGPLSLSSVSRPILIGVGLVALGILFGVILDPNSEESFVWLLTDQGLRAILLVGLVAAGLAFLLYAASRAQKVSELSGLAVSLLAVASTVTVAFVVQSEAASKKFRAELFAAMLLVALVMFGWAVARTLFEVRRRPDVEADRLGKRLVTFGIVSVIAGIVIRLLWTTTVEAPNLTGATTFRISILWFVAVAAVATWVLARTRFGSWTFAVGGNKDASRQVGVPAARTKTQLFMIVAAAAWLVGMLLAFRLNTLQANTGDGKEFEYIIAAVVGGNLLTGGYGSAAGAAIGALIMAMAQQGIPFAGWESDWRFLFLGVILLLAVLGNNYIRKTAAAAS